MKFRDLKVGDSISYLILDVNNVSELNGMKVMSANILEKISNMHLVTDVFGDFQFEKESELDLESACAESEDSILLLATTNDGIRIELKKLLG